MSERVEMIGLGERRLVAAIEVPMFEARGYWRADAMPRAQSAPGPAVPGRAAPAVAQIPAPPKPQPEDFEEGQCP